MYETTDFRKGLHIEYDSKAYTIVEFQHVNPGKGSAFVRTKLKNLESGKVLDVTFKAGVDRVGVPDLQFREMQYLYHQGGLYTFMDMESYEQWELREADLGRARYYLIPDSMVKVTYYKGKPVAVELENFVELKVSETQPNIKGDTASGGSKPALMETGLQIQVPFHIERGHRIRIDTRSDKYVERVK